MNINAFEKKLEENIGTGISFAEEEALLIKQKIQGKKNKQKKLKTLLITLFSAIFILTLVIVYLQVRQMRLSKNLNTAKEQLAALTASSTALTKELEDLRLKSGAPASLSSAEDVVKTLKRHIILPEGEEPQIVKIQDAEKLRTTQSFFKNVENDDIVLVYTASVFVYRPSKDIIVSSGNVSETNQIR